ncbi:MAG: hypothetical protein H7Y18_18495 [Clostridiaceae bacterium]|nr:hypothetical protein [Clostridiaceae bacterium]
MLEREKSIIIISTTVSICVMLLTGIDASQEKKVVIKKENIKSQTEIVIDKLKDENTDTKVLNNLQSDKGSNTLENKDHSVAVKETEKPIKKPVQVKPIEVKPIEKDDVGISKAPESNGNESNTTLIPEVDLKKDEGMEKTAPVFKVKKEDIMGELSFFDKEKLLLISAKLKTSDYKKINELLEGDVDGQGVLSSLRLLKARLSKNDYTKIKQIFGKFINIDLVEN